MVCLRLWGLNLSKPMETNAMLQCLKFVRSRGEKKGLLRVTGSTCHRWLFLRLLLTKHTKFYLFLLKYIFLSNLTKVFFLSRVANQPKWWKWERILCNAVFFWCTALRFPVSRRQLLISYGKIAAIAMYSGRFATSDGGKLWFLRTLTCSTWKNNSDKRILQMNECYFPKSLPKSA